MQHARHVVMRNIERLCRSNFVQVPRQTCIYELLSEYSLIPLISLYK